MPPALSDDENSASTGEEELQVGPASAVEEEEGEEEENDDAEEPDEYVVEKILSHRYNKAGVLEFNVKWQGWEKKSDRTWEPEDNLATAADILDEYFEEIGGRPQAKATKGSNKKRNRKSGVESEVATTPASSTKRAKKDKEWSPPPGSWENDVDYVDTVEESADPKTGEMTRYAYLVWTNSKKTQHPLVHIYHKCPQKMLKYYESHLVFTHSPDENLNGDTIMKGSDDSD